ncbi:MAG: OmpA family protein [Myxococcota bacterium]
MRRRRRTAQISGKERWLISYADFITLLFAFFTTLYAISIVDAVKAQRLVHSIKESFGEGVMEGGRPALLETDPGSLVGLGDESGGGWRTGGDGALARAAHRIDKLPISEGTGAGISLHQTKRGLVITLADSLFFESGEVTLPEPAREALGEIATVLQDLPNHILVEGHTDNRPAAPGPNPTNWHVSATRAVEVLLELARKGVADYRLSASGFGDQRPLVSNRTDEGQRMNRRVDIVVLRVMAATGE